VRPHTNIEITSGAVNVGISHLAAHVAATLRETQPAVTGPIAIRPDFFGGAPYYPQPQRETDDYVPPPRELTAEDLRRLDEAQKKRERKAARKH
jgi:hypothetical protein